MRLHGLHLVFLVGCASYTDLANTGTACVAPPGAEVFDLYDYSSTPTPTNDPVAVPAGPSEVVVILDNCYSSSVEEESAACSVSVDGTTLEVRSEGGYYPPRGGQNDDCNMLSAACDGPELTEGTWTLSYGGREVTFQIPATETPCVGR